MCQVKVTFLLKNSKKNKVKDSFGEADKIVASCKGVKGEKVKVRCYYNKEEIGFPGRSWENISNEIHIILI